MPNTLVLIHGYSDKGKSFMTWRDRLKDRYENTEQICICDYVSLTNEVTIKDLAEGFELALKTKAGLKDDEDFDAIVHSTGMLVIRSWLTTYPARRGRLKHLIGIAPATFGSPLARKGRSWIGAIFKGNRDIGPDFLESGDMILDGLELGSPFTWALAEKDMLGETVFYGTTDGTPYVHIFCGTEEYGGLRKAVSTPGTDGTVRLAGAGFNVRKIVLDLTKNQSILNPEGKKNVKRWRIDDWKNADIPVHLVDGLNHGTILTEPSDELVDLVRDALDVDDAPSFKAWLKKADAGKHIQNATKGHWQQFIVRAYDERNDPITDYNLQLFTAKTYDVDKRVTAFDENVDVYSKDASFRSFLVNLDNVPLNDELWLSVMASSGTDFVSYEGWDMDPDAKRGPVTSRRNSDAWLDLSGFMNPGDGFLAPFTTTLVEVYLDREPDKKLVQLK